MICFPPLLRPENSPLFIDVHFAFFDRKVITYLKRKLQEVNYNFCYFRSLSITLQHTPSYQTFNLWLNYRINCDKEH